MNSAQIGVGAFALIGVGLSGRGAGAPSPPVSGARCSAEPDGRTSQGRLVPAAARALGSEAGAATVRRAHADSRAAPVFASSVPSSEVAADPHRLHTQSNAAWSPGSICVAFHL